jgi:hypothetical protein
VLTNQGIDNTVILRAKKNAEEIGRMYALLTIPEQQHHFVGAVLGYIANANEVAPRYLIFLCL